MLWHRLVAPDLKLPNHEIILDKFHTDLDGAQIETLVLSVLFNVTHTWSRADLFALADRRLEQLRQRKIPSSFPHDLILRSSSSLQTRTGSTATVSKRVPRSPSLSSWTLGMLR